MAFPVLGGSCSLRPYQKKTTLSVSWCEISKQVRVTDIFEGSCRLHLIMVIFHFKKSLNINHFPPFLSEFLHLFLQYQISILSTQLYQNLNLVQQKVLQRNLKSLIVPNLIPAHLKYLSLFLSIFIYLCNIYLSIYLSIHRSLFLLSFLISLPQEQRRVI